MLSKSLIDSKNTALLVIDIQNDYCSSLGEIALERGLDVSPVQEAVPAIINFVDLARDRGLPIIFTQMIEDPKYMAKNARLKKGDKKACSPNTKGFEYYKISPKKSDYQIIKRTYDAFSNPELKKILDRHNIKNLIIIGAYTAVCVDTTVRSGFTKGYNIIIPENLVSMVKEKEDLHKGAINVWKMIFAHVVNSSEIVDKWKQKPR